MLQDVLRIKIAEEKQARVEAENAMIAAYVPEADLMSREEALELALKRDLEAALALAASIESSGLNLKGASEIAQLMHNLGY